RLVAVLTPTVLQPPPPKNRNLALLVANQLIPSAAYMLSVTGSHAAPDCIALGVRGSAKVVPANSAPPFSPVNIQRFVTGLARTTVGAVPGTSCVGPMSAIVYRPFVYTADCTVAVPLSIA